MEEVSSRAWLIEISVVVDNHDMGPASGQNNGIFRALMNMQRIVGVDNWMDEDEETDFYTL